MIKAYLDRILVPFPLVLRPSLLLGLFELMSAGRKERFNSDYRFGSSETESVCAIASILFLCLQYVYVKALLVSVCLFIMYCLLYSLIVNRFG